TSDKSVVHSITSVGMNFKRYIVQGRPNNELIDIAYNNLVKPEILRILDAQKNPDKYNYEGTKEGSSMFIIFPELNNRGELFLENTRILKDITKNKNIEQIVKNYIADFLNKEVNKRVNK